MTSTPQLTAWATRVACCEAWPRGQAEACKAPADPGVLGPNLVPCSLLLSAPLWLHRPPALPPLPPPPTGLTLWPQDPAELGERSAPKEVGVHAGPGPLAHPLPRAKRAQGYDKK